MISLTLDRIRHRYAHTDVLADVSFAVECGTVLGCIGRNGSGKSTLLRIVAGLLVPTSGKVTLSCGGQTSDDPFTLRARSGYCAPALTLYDELTVAEQIAFHCACRGLRESSEEIERLLDESSLARYRSMRIGELSSGTVQRLKLLLAFLGSPPLVVLDEPTTNLDGAGIETLRTWIERAAAGAIVVVATNVPTELAWCTHLYDVERRIFSHASINARARADQE